jgi:hypothetical protein
MTTGEMDKSNVECHKVTIDNADERRIIRAGSGRVEIKGKVIYTISPLSEELQVQEDAVIWPEGDPHEQRRGQHEEEMDAFLGAEPSPYIVCHVYQ